MCGHGELAEIICLAKTQVCLVVFWLVSNQWDQFSDQARCLSVGRKEVVRRLGLMF